MVDKESQKGLIVFQDRKIRRLWYDNQWFYSVVDIVAVLSESDNPTTYWRVLKHREPQLVTICNGLKMPAEDELRYALEIKLTNPTVLNGDLEKIKD